MKVLLYDVQVAIGMEMLWVCHRSPTVWLGLDGFIVDFFPVAVEY